MSVIAVGVGRNDSADGQTQEERFLEECCERDPDSWVRPGKLYCSYTTWCEEHDLEPLSLNQVAPVWKRLGLRRTTVKGYPRLWGVRLLVEGHAYDSFTPWLKKQRHRTGEPIGRLADEVSADRTWPKGRPSLELYERYLRSYGSPEWYLDILRAAWAEWLEYRQSS